MKIRLIKKISPNQYGFRVIFAVERKRMFGWKVIGLFSAEKDANKLYEKVKEMGGAEFQTLKEDSFTE